MAGLSTFFSLLNCFKSCKSDDLDEGGDVEDGVNVQSNVDVNNVTVCCISTSNGNRSKCDETMQSVYSLATEVGKEGSGEKRKRSFRKNAMILG